MDVPTKGSSIRSSIWRRCAPAFFSTMTGFCRWTPNYNRERAPTNPKKQKKQKPPAKCRGLWNLNSSQGDLENVVNDIAVIYIEDRIKVVDDDFAAVAVHDVADAVIEAEVFTTVIRRVI